MNRFTTALALTFASLLLTPPAASGAEPAHPLRILVLGAHPDDPELKASGVALKWVQQGHHVKFVSVTNGDIGHWKIKGEELAKRRASEARAADKLLGVESEVLPIHDGELEPTLENRRTITRIIRKWNADIVIGHRPCDYHPDHRYVGILMQDAAYMVTVPFFCPDTPPLKKNPVFLYLSDEFQKPTPFKADIIVGIDDVFDRKIDVFHELESQTYEGGANGSEADFKQVPPASDVAARKAWMRKSWWAQDSAAVADRHRADLIKRYGAEVGKAVRCAEAFEICEYGTVPTAAEIEQLFPFFGKIDATKK